MSHPAVKPEFDPHPLKAPLYLHLYPFMSAFAQRLGYALAVHGSMSRDFDIIAVPWTEEAVEPETLAAELAKCIDGELWDTDKRNGSFAFKPHFRRCWSIHVKSTWVGDCYIDLSVTPRSQDIKYHLPLLRE